MKLLLQKKVKELEKLAGAPRWKRLLKRPWRYLQATSLYWLIPSFEKEIKVKTFFGEDMHLMLPSALDIYLTGGKTHSSETRLAKFIIQSLQEGDSFLDIGAHFGYFSLLASKLVGKTGQVISIEPSQTTFYILQQNAAGRQNMKTYHAAASDKEGTQRFFELPNKYSEYNSLDVEQYKNTNWFKKLKLKENLVETIVIDNFLQKNELKPRIIKIDVEGAEEAVLRSIKNYLKTSDPLLAVELRKNEHNQLIKTHQNAVQLMINSGFSAHKITPEGNLSPLSRFDQNELKEWTESENIVFSKNPE